MVNVFSNLRLAKGIQDIAVDYQEVDQIQSDSEEEAEEDYMLIYIAMYKTDNQQLLVRYVCCCGTKYIEN